MDTEPSLYYWISRATIVFLWGLVAIRAWHRARSSPRPRSWQVAMLLGSWLAILRATRLDWRLMLYLQGRFLDRPFYDVLSQVEYVLLVLIACTAVFLLFYLSSHLRRARPDSGAAFTVVAAGFMLLFTVWETFSVEEFIPLALQEQPGRYAVELALAGVAVLGTWRRAGAGREVEELSIQPGAPDPL